VQAGSALRPSSYPSPIWVPRPHHQCGSTLVVRNHSIHDAQELSGLGRDLGVLCWMTAFDSTSKISPTSAWDVDLPDSSMLAAQLLELRAA